MPSKRIKEIVKMIPKSRVIGDIACDHGYISIEAVKQGKTNKAIAADLRVDPLNSARKNIELAGLNDKIELRLSDGLKEFNKNEIDTVVLCGIGGELMIEILRDRISDFKYFLLSPQSKIENVREFLKDNNLRFLDEKIVWDLEKPYILMLLENDETKDLENLSDLELKYGKCLIERKDENLRKYLEYEKKNLEKIMEKTENENLRALYSLNEKALNEISR